MELEFLLSRSGFARPRQFVLHSDQVLDGAGLERLLETQFGPGPYFCADRPLAALGRLAPREAMVITDVPARQPSADPPALQLYVLEGPCAGAGIALVPGVHRVGRCAPLWLQDPALARVQATVQVDHRSIRLRPAPGQQVQLLDAHAGARPVGHGEELTLVRGAVIRVGQTLLKVDDPLDELEPGAPRWPATPPKLPPKPEGQRLVALLGAALVPLAIGIVLAVATGSRLFLVISACTALLAGIPALGLIRARRRHRHAVCAHTRQWLRARELAAPALGTVLAAATTREYRQLHGARVPPLVLGTGSWTPEPEHAAAPPDTTWPSVVFAVQATGAWQLVTAQPEAGMPLLRAIVARLLPAVFSGGAALVIDPALDRLPAALLLLPNVRLGVPPPSVRAPLAGGPAPVLEVIYLVAGTAIPRPAALVIGLGPRPDAQATGWVDPVTGAAKLDDPQARLLTPYRLCADHFERIVQRHLGLAGSRPRPAPTPPGFEAPLAGTPPCLLGYDRQGRGVGIDLEHDGPHLLVAGTTGSGKSEALRRILAELADQHSPHQLALALVDFKGGASLQVFQRLPHTQMFCSDLDGAQALRMLDQLDLEIRRRERVLQHAGCSDITEYALLPGTVPPLPRLLVVIDEFRVFIDQLPDAPARIDRLATVGRALGIHLLLSTQKPSGTLSPQTRANLNAVIVLRVREATESSELLGTPEAAGLSEPGEAILRSASRGATRFRFALAAGRPATGYLAERARTGFSEHGRCVLGQNAAPRAPRQLLLERVDMTIGRWAGHAPVDNPFAPELPQSLHQAPHAAVRGNQVLCGLLDDLPNGRLQPLLLGGSGAPALAVNGLAESGTAHLAEQLLRLPARMLYFDASPIGMSTADGSLRVLTGRDTYAFGEALDYLAGGPDLDGLLVLIRNIASLCAELPAALWARFDEVVATLVRQGSGSGVRVIIIGDRDLSMLKSAQLCTRRWYFPLGAAPALTMTWPKLPPVSALPGRGIQVAPDGLQHTIQLTALRCDPLLTAQPWPTPALENDGSGWFLGSTGLEPRPVHFRPSRIGFVLVPEAGLRPRVARLLSARWGLALCGQDLAAGAEGRVGLLLDGPPDPSQLAAVQSWAEQGRTPVVFCPPSARLAYDFSLPAMSLDERDVLVLEATHPYDLQPLNWPVLARSVPDPRYWRGVMLVGGQPRRVHIAGDSPAAP